MDSSHYQPPKPNALTRFLWRAAGADAHILTHCPYGEHVKFACLGGIVASTGVLAFIAASYALYTIFAPVGDAAWWHEAAVRVGSMLFGALWGLIIFNLDRYIVASTGKGDGTERITWQEFQNALPRIALGIIIAITISKPLELRIFKPEIDAQLFQEQRLAEQRNRRAIEANYSQDLADIDGKVAKLEASVNGQAAKAQAAELAATAELDGTGGSGRASPGPIYQAKRTIAAREQATLEDLRRDLAPKLAALQRQRGDKEAAMQEDLRASRQTVGGISGFLARMQAAHKLAGSMITGAITLLFVAIELTPIFFKLMLIKGPYDYFEENVKELLLARHGIERVHEFLDELPYYGGSRVGGQGVGPNGDGARSPVRPDRPLSPDGAPTSGPPTSGPPTSGPPTSGVGGLRAGLTHDRVTFHHARSVIASTKAAMQRQEALAHHALETWHAQEQARITADPTPYIEVGAVSPAAPSRVG